MQIDFVLRASFVVDECECRIGASSNSACEIFVVDKDCFKGSQLLAVKSRYMLLTEKPASNWSDVLEVILIRFAFSWIKSIRIVKNLVVYRHAGCSALLR